MHFSDRGITSSRTYRIYCHHDKITIPEVIFTNLISQI
jgi:hypothetical protein